MVVSRSHVGILYAILRRYLSREKLIAMLKEIEAQQVWNKSVAQTVNRLLVHAEEQGR